MKRTRIFTSLVILTCLWAALLLTLAVDHVSRSGRVVGTVLFQGRPVCQGTIFFQSEDPRRSDGTSAQIDEQGHFECEPGWHRDHSAWTRFKISVVLDRRNLRPDPPSAGSEAVREATGVQPQDLVPGGAQGLVSQIVPASMGLPARDPPARSTEADRGRPRRIVYDQGLAVLLGSEPAHLEIRLRD